jgi:hypothetical protein
LVALAVMVALGLLAPLASCITDRTVGSPPRVGTADPTEPVAPVQGGPGQSTPAGLAAASRPTVVIYVSGNGVDANGGTQLAPVRTIQRGVDLANRANVAGSDAVIAVAGGIYREAVTIAAVNSTNTLTIEGTGTNTVLTGADDWSSGWTLQLDGSYVHDWPYRWGVKPIPSGWESYWNWDQNAVKRDILRRSEMVYVDGRPLQGVLSLDQLAAPGTFYVDERASRLYMRLPDDARVWGALIEVGIRKTPLRIAGRNNVVLRDLTIARNQGAIQDAAVQASNLQNLTLERVRVHWAAATGLGTASVAGLSIVDSVFSDNGIYGHSDYRSRGAVVEDSEVARNNWRGWPAELKGFDTVYKWSETRDVTIRRARIIDNLGHGIWFDGDNQRVTVEDSFVARNGRDRIGRGIFLEINGGPITIQRNRICDNGEGGVVDGRSNNVTVSRNEISNNGSYQIEFTGSDVPVTITDSVTGQPYTVDTSYWTIVDNVIKGGPLASGAIPAECYPGPCGWLVWTPDADHYRQIAATLVADRNVYYHSLGTESFRVPDAYGRAVTLSGWRTLVSGIRANEANSTFSDPGALSCTQQVVDRR